jgi:hypothetical protein
MTEIILSQKVNTPYLVAVDDGLKVFKEIKNELNRGNTLNLSFKGVRSLTSAFLNASIGKLLEEYKRQDIENNINFEDLTPTYEVLIKRVIDTAEEFYTDSGSYGEKLKTYYGNNS